MMNCDRHQPTPHQSPEILDYQPAGSHVPGQEDPAPTYLQKIWEALINHQQQQKGVHDKKNAKTLPDLHTDQEILCITTKSSWIPENITQIGQEPIDDIVTAPKDATYRYNRKTLKALDYIYTPNTSPIPGLSIEKRKTFRSLSCNCPST